MLKEITSTNKNHIKKRKDKKKQQTHKPKFLSYGYYVVLRFLLVRILALPSVTPPPAPPSEP